MNAPGMCNYCGVQTNERFPIIVKDGDCRPRYCRECATVVNQSQMVNVQTPTSGTR